MRRLAEGFVLGDRYVLESRIASGGMADVWRGMDTVLKRVVALKVMRADAENEAVFQRRFRDEALHSAALMHPNITTVFDYGEDDHLSFLVMELVEGSTLSALIRENGPMSPTAVTSIVGQSALALGVAHEAGVVHRDVKPANVLLRPDGVVKLTDFGIARVMDASGHTRMGEMLGTPDYISPEQAQGEPASGASDLYALGVVAHELLTGDRPFDRGTPIATAMSHVNEPPPPLSDDVPEDLRELIGALLEKKPEDRPANAREVALRMGMASQELAGLALGLAALVQGDYYGDDTPTPRTLLPSETPEPNGTPVDGLGQPTVAGKPSFAE